MITICVESALKSQAIGKLLSDIPNFCCVFTAGRIFDLSLSGNCSSWEVVNPDIHNYLLQQFGNSESVIAMTDADEQGELIAYQISLLAEGKPCAKANVFQMTREGVLDAIRAVRPIDTQVVIRTLAERFTNYEIGKCGALDRLAGVSLAALKVAIEIESGTKIYTKTQSFEKDGYHLSATVLTKDLNCTLSEPFRHQPPSTADVLLDAVLDNRNAVTVAKDLQNLYDSGLAAYSRTPSHEWDSSSIRHLESLVIEAGYDIDTNRLRSYVNDHVSHPALYTSAPFREHYGLTYIQQRAMSCIIKGDRYKELGSQVRSSDSAMHFNAKVISKGRPNDCSKIATPEQFGFYILEANQLCKPSTLAIQTSKIAKLLWPNGLEVTNALNRYVNHAKKNYPKIEMAEKVLSFISNQAKEKSDVNSVTSTALHISNNALAQLSR